MSNSGFSRELQSLRAYVEREHFMGYDPYDALNARFNFGNLGKWGPILAIQVQKRNPLNIRPLLGIERDFNPKAIGIFLHAYSMLLENDPDEDTRKTADYLFTWLVDHSSQGYSGYSWGYNFDWASPAKYLPAYVPSIVVTGFVARGIFKYYEATNSLQALEILRSACDFLLNDLPRTQTPDGICFSYTPVMKDCCFNASMLGAELLAKLYSVTGDQHLRELSTRAVDFVLSYQKPDGRWNYSVDIESGTERIQIDFHQGYILDSLDAFIKYTHPDDSTYKTALVKGARFYRQEQFCENGRSLWRLPRKWPVDIHNQAQGIITFSNLTSIDPSYRAFAERICRWTCHNMQDEQGYFYYRKGRLHTNKVPYMRWAQAWMMLALAHVAQFTQAAV